MSIILDGSTGITTPNIISPTQIISTKLDLTGGQIKFPATQVPSSDANTLDDYEEGTWTPILSGSSGGEYSGTNHVGKYIKIGSIVHIDFSLSWTGVVTPYSGLLVVNGLPFANAYGLRHAGSISAVQSGLTFTSGYTNWQVLSEAGLSRLYIIQMGSNGGSFSHSPTVGTSGAILGIHLSYMI